MNKQNKKTNPNLVELIDQLKEKSRETGSALWRDVAIRLSKSRKNWAQPNLSRLSRYAPEGAIVLIPGKLLGSGEVEGSPTVAAYSASEGARDKIIAAGGKYLSCLLYTSPSPRDRG